MSKKQSDNEFEISREQEEEMENAVLSLDDEERVILEQHLNAADNLEEFLALAMVGPCPRCGSTRVADGEDAPGIEDITIGMCLDCDYLWCLDCGEQSQPGVECPHHGVCAACNEGSGEDEDEDDDRQEFCLRPVWECPTILRWRAERKNERRE
ncbi:MAG: hypothetical protein PHE84_01820 [bacterium]|nr:hypothetical protein [bacterium]